MAHPILNPVDFQSLRPLRLAESQFAEYLQVARREGAKCVVGNGVIPDKPIPDGKCDDISNVVRGEVIRFFAHGGSEECPVRGSFIRLQGAWVEGELDLTHADIPYALIFHNCHFAGPVQMRHAECRELDLCGSRLAMGLEGNPLRTRGSVKLGRKFVADDTVDLSSARIDGVLDCCGGKFHNGLMANKAKMGVLMWDNVDGGGDIEIMSAKADILEDSLEAWKPFEVVLDGFTYDQIFGPTDAKSRIEWLGKRPRGMPFSPLPYEQVAKVLRSMGKDIDAWDIEREKRRLEREELDSQNAPKVPLWRRLWGRRIDALTDFVYRPWKTLGAAMLIVAAGVGVFGFAAHHEKIVPHQPPILSSAEYQAERAKGLSPMESVQAAFPKEYPEFSPLAYSLDVFIPFFALHQEPFWNPASGGDGDLWKASLLLALLVAAALALGGLASLLANWIRREWGDDFAGAGAAGVGMAAVLLLLGVGFAAGFAHAWLDFDLVAWLADWRWLTVWHWLEIGAGWVLTSLFLLSITGLLRPRQSSGEKG